MRFKNSTNILLSIQKFTEQSFDGDEKTCLKIQATINASDFQEYSVQKFDLQNNICYHIIIPKSIDKINMGFIKEVEEKLSNINLSQLDEQIEKEVATCLSETDLESIIKNYQNQNFGVKVGNLYYNLEELKEIKNYLIESGEI